MAWRLVFLYTECLKRLLIWQGNTSEYPKHSNLMNSQKYSIFILIYYTAFNMLLVRLQGITREQVFKNLEC